MTVRTETSSKDLLLPHAFTAGQFVIEAEFPIAIVAGAGAVGLAGFILFSYC